MQNNENKNSSWKKEGMVLNWIFGKLQGNDFVIYMYLVRKTIGYNQYTSEPLSYEKIELSTGINKRTITRIIPKLIKDNYIIKISTNQVAHEGKLPYAYQLNMKLKNFPNLGKLKKYKNDNNYLSNDSKKTFSDYTKEELNLMSFEEKHLLVHGTRPDHIEI